MSGFGYFNECDGTPCMVNMFDGAAVLRRAATGGEGRGREGTGREGLSAMAQVREPGGGENGPARWASGRQSLVGDKIIPLNESLFTALWLTQESRESCLIFDVIFSCLI